MFRRMKFKVNNFEIMKFSMISQVVSQAFMIVMTILHHKFTLGLCELRVFISNLPGGLFFIFHPPQ